MRRALAFVVLVLLTAGLPGLAPVIGHAARDATPLSMAPSVATPTTDEPTGLKGKTYTSPQFGYVVTWQSPWEPDNVSSDPETGDYLRLGTGDLVMEYHGFSTDQSLEQAHEDFVAARARTHLGATPQYQAPGGGQARDSPALWQFNYTRADGIAMGEVTTAFSVGSGRAVLMRTVSRSVTDASPRSLYYAVSLFLDPMEATAAAQRATEQASEQRSLPTSRATNLQTLTGTVRLTQFYVVAADGTCTGAGPFRDVGPGLPITVANVVDVVLVRGGVVGAGTLVPAQSGSGRDCLFTFSIASVPVQPFYRISVGSYIERRVIDQGTLESKNWSIEFVL